jgi:hypothetical protein
MTQARVFQQGVQVIHNQMPADAGIARASQLAVQVVRDRADWVGDFARVYQHSAQIVHGHLPANSGTARVAQLAVQVVRAVGEAGGGGGGARRSVMVVAT